MNITRENIYNSWEDFVKEKPSSSFYMWNRSLTPHRLLNGKRQREWRWFDEQTSSQASTAINASRSEQSALFELGRQTQKRWCWYQIGRELVLFQLEKRVHSGLHSCMCKHLHTLSDEQTHLPANPGRNQLQGRDRTNAARGLSKPVQRPASPATSKINQLLHHVRLSARVLLAVAKYCRK